MKGYTSHDQAKQQLCAPAGNAICRSTRTGDTLILSGLAGPAAAAPAQLPRTITSNPDGQQAIYEDGRYIVMLDSAPLATYEGGVAGIGATKPAKGEKLNDGTTHAKKYRAHLTNKQDDVAASEGVKIQKSFTTAVNGFVAELTGLQAAELAKNPGVVAVAASVERSRSPSHAKAPKSRLSISKSTRMRRRPCASSLRKAARQSSSRVTSATRNSAVAPSTTR